MSPIHGQPLGGRLERPLGGRLGGTPEPRPEHTLGGPFEQPLGGHLEQPRSGHLEQPRSGHLEQPFGSNLDETPDESVADSMPAPDLEIRHDTVEEVASEPLLDPTIPPGLPRTAAIDAALLKELRPGEELWYAGMPSTKGRAKIGLIYVFLGLPFFGGSIAIMSVALQALLPDFLGYPSVPVEDPLPVLGGGFLMMLFSAVMMYAPWRFADEARHEVHCVSNQRAFLLKIGAYSHLYSWDPHVLVRVSTRGGKNGYGYATLVRNAETIVGTTRREAMRFDCIPDPRAYEMAIRRLIELHGTPSTPTDG
jgi:hypothetical protein